MYDLTVSAAIAAVRKNFDESGLNASMMYAPPDGESQATDNDEMDATIARTLPEAINSVVAAAPAFMLEGLTPSEVEITDIEGKVLSFALSDEVLRLVKLRATDTDQIVTEILSEASPEGRMQLNPVICGTYDKPRLVQLVGSQNNPEFRYYSLKETGGDPESDWQAFIDELKYLPPCHYKRGSLYKSATDAYSVPHDILDKILYRLTGMVLSIYGENDRANYFNNLANF